MAKTQTMATEAPAREPVAVFEIPQGLRDGELGLDSNRTINAWALDKVLAFMGAHRVDIVGAVALSPEGNYCELVRDGDSLKLFATL